MALAASGCGKQSTLDTHSAQSHDIRTLFWWLLAVALIVFLGAVAMLVVAWIRRSEPGLPLGAMRAHGELLELRANELGFTSGEADALLNGTLEKFYPSQG